MNNGIIIHIFKIFYCFWFAPLVIAEILEVANNPNLNKNRGSTVQGKRWFQLHMTEY